MLFQDGQMVKAKEQKQGSPAIRLKERRNRLIYEFLERGNPDFLRDHALVFDDYFHECYEKSDVGPELNRSSNPYGLIALGGYGRQEQCIHSDIDLLFIFENEVPESAADLIQEMVYPLWDMCVDVGHATHSLETCIQMALSDVEVLTGLLDARFICGKSLLYSRIMEMLRDRVIQGRSDDIIKEIIQRNQERHQHFGDSAFLLEPNLKEGKGGLRDYHTMLWIARIQNNLSQPRDLEYYGILSHDEFKTLTGVLSFIWQVRSRLHHLAGRKCDQLYFMHQEALADVMGYKAREGQQPVERFLGDLHQGMNFLKQQHLMRVYEIENLQRKRGRKASEKTRTPGIVSARGMLNFAASEMIPEHPDLLIKIFEESARTKLPLSAEAKRLVKEFLYLVNADFRTSTVARQSFEYILLARVPRFNVMEAMLETDFLTAYIPQFKQVSDRIQYDEYHVYPVDKHLLRTVRNMKEFGTPEDTSKSRLCGEIYTEMPRQDRKLLLWAALLHDVGKGQPGGNHSQKGEMIAREILTRKGYAEQEIETVCFLVREHLLLADMAARRDIQDEETSLVCARRIKEVERLRMLFLLTAADSISTGPKAWNTWIAALQEGLFLNIQSTLKNGELTSGEALEQVERKKQEIFKAAPEEQADLERLFAIMSPRYLLYTPAADIMEHIRLFKNLGAAHFVWEIGKSAVPRARRVTICARDFPGLFSKIAGVFTLNGVDILNATIFTWRNNVALDVFNVRPPADDLMEQEKWKKAEKDLRDALAGELDLEKAIRERTGIYGFQKPRASEREVRVVVDNESSSFFTIVEVYTHDYPGLLFGITDALFKCRLDIWVAKISTKVDQVVDVFYVRDFDGQKVEAPDQTEAIKTALNQAMVKAREAACLYAAH